MSITGHFEGGQVSNLAPFTQPSILGSWWKGIWPGTVGRQITQHLIRTKNPAKLAQYILISELNQYIFGIYIALDFMERID